eukprot:CAMPEP_0184873604 /NCGR_PEP_ID=MMETSP0580-20130426/41938_1 /TAXON_ID=1118495 /ORGANISM="Dactyliosolen fragilissimus" /LENGTH=115 /DNA_ID=CAMNT_0027376531 /DNA_START=46 /DNA_END=390 /DNA_ORIENTATION=+
MNSLLTSLSENAVETSERIIKVFEEGASILFGDDHSDHTDNHDNNKHYNNDYTHDHNNNNDNHNHDNNQSEEDYLNMPSPLNGIADNVIQDLMKSQTGPQNLKEHVEAFTAAINW